MNTIQLYTSQKSIGAKREGERLSRVIVKALEEKGIICLGPLRRGGEVFFMNAKKTTLHAVEDLRGHFQVTEVIPGNRSCQVRYYAGEGGWVGSLTTAYRIRSAILGEAWDPRVDLDKTKTEVAA